MEREVEQLYEGLAAEGSTPKASRGRRPISEAELAAVEAEGAEYAAGDALFNDAVALPSNGRTVRQREAPHHRLFASLRARGYTLTEIAEITGYSVPAISIALRQPYARKRLVEALQKDEDAIAAVLKAEAMPSLELLCAVRDDEEARKADRLRAAENLLDRYLGKPTQRVETREAPPPVDLEACQREIEDLRRQREALQRC